MRVNRDSLSIMNPSKDVIGPAVLLYVQSLARRVTTKVEKVQKRRVSTSRKAPQKAVLESSSTVCDDLSWRDDGYYVSCNTSSRLQSLLSLLCKS
jgi:hypothetical protein